LTEWNCDDPHEASQQCMWKRYKHDWDRYTEKKMILFLD